MTTDVEVERSGDGENKVVATKLFREYCGLNIKQSKGITDQLIQGRVLAVSVIDGKDAEELRTKLLGARFTARIVGNAT